MRYQNLSKLISCICILTSASSAQGGEPLKSAKPWVVDYQPSECNAQRAYDNASQTVFLAVRPAPTGASYELLLIAVGHQGPRYAEERKGSVDFGHGPIEAWLLHYGVTGAHSADISKFRISSDEMAQAKAANAVTFHVSGRPDLTFALESLPALMKSLDECNVDLQHYWNMIDPEKKNIGTPVIGDVRSTFTSDDYPDEAYYRGQEGRSQFLLLIDEAGKVAGCHVVAPSGIPIFDVMGCQVIRERSTFKPAMDKQGKRIRMGFITPEVIWRLDF